uniref:Uncharacterized protein n=3 Tax=Physcomitrium patens TaxID=3218 RepID=A9RIP5_PHYPA|nr:membrane protein PM19L-like [Physcomitrium patens]PNR45268.1 hypothetical protein PHYPA_015039 [Physcomitrium patens]|eukprot:XP_024389722.1 membrane protein PM19L-like [Physcomitrella patens]
MAFGIGKVLIMPLMVINFGLYFIAACLAGSILNRNLDANMHRNDDIQIGNVATVNFIPFALIACMAGLASVFAGGHHIRIWRTESLAAAAATSLIAWLLTLLAMGLACKEIHTSYGRTKRLKTLEAFMIILSLFELLYLLALHAGSVHTNDGVVNTTGHRGVKNPNYGTPAATAV